jgi:hypothetical protein
MGHASHVPDAYGPQTEDEHAAWEAQARAEEEEFTMLAPYLTASPFDAYRVWTHDVTTEEEDTPHG